MAKRLVSFWFSGLLLAAVAAPAFGQDWPQWRGPYRDGSAPDFPVPAVWPKELVSKWQVEVGLGHSSPVVVAERVYQLSREGDEEVVRCLDLVTGEAHWRQSYPAPYKVNPAAQGHGPGPKSTPLVYRGRVYTLGISGILSCWNESNGRLLWQQEFSQQYKATSPLYGTATSPIAPEGLIVTYVGGHDSGALVAFDPTTGAERWKLAGDGPGYASPVLAEIEGVPQLITQSQSSCLAVDPNTGGLLWKFPFKTDYDQNIVTPLVVPGLVIFSGTGKGTSAYRLSKRGDAWTPTEVWHNEASMYMNSPVASGGRLFGLSEDKKGQLFCLEAATGKTLWTGDPRFADNALLVRTSGAILALTTGGDLVAFADAADRYRELARYKVSETPTWAHPALIPAGILVKGERTLALWGLE
jgi:outer membrane protein assembly factor BamB